MSWLWLGHFLILKMNDVLNLLFNEYNSFFYNLFTVFNYFKIMKEYLWTYFHYCFILVDKYNLGPVRDPTFIKSEHLHCTTNLYPQRL